LRAARDSGGPWRVPLSAAVMTVMAVLLETRCGEGWTGTN
jgi:hypothetical protein